jgi:GntR family transcriptional regulator
MLFRVDHASTVSLAEQIAVQIRVAVLTGELMPSERLPPTRELATSSGINMHTVLRADGDLHDERIIEMRQGRGAWVHPEVEPGFVRLAVIAEQFRAEARKLGLSKTEIRRLIEGT